LAFQEPWDPIVIPEQLQKFYSEKVLLVPPSYQVNDIRRERHDTLVNRADFGLPEDAFIFCSFNNNYKITPEMFDIWCDLLVSVPKSIIWMLSDNKSAETNLKNHARVRGIDPARLIFAPRVAINVHLSRHRLADLFLDTYPCNAHTTASDALFMGLPIVTRIGETFASRVAASLLTAAGLPELIATSPEKYKEIALHLARNPDEIARMRTGLLDGIRDTQLYDTATFTKNFESLLEQIVRRPE
jgi:protein O-GlcNAc transferase